MTDVVQSSEALRRRIATSLRRRYLRERAFKALGFLSVAGGLAFLFVLLGNVTVLGVAAFQRAEVRLPVTVTASKADPAANLTRASLMQGDYDAVIDEALRDVLGVAVVPESLVSAYAPVQLRDQVAADPELVGRRIDVRVPASARVDQWLRDPDARDSHGLGMASAEAAAALLASGRLERAFNRSLFANGDSREAELAGVRAAIAGSLWMLLITVVLAAPVGIAAALYLEEYAARNRWTGLIETNINNLAAVPSIVYGLLGVAILINGIGLPRSAPLTGGVILALLSLPVVIIATRLALQQVPRASRDAALALGASRTQTVFQHVLPQAVPGILTGVLLAMSRALGEAAPLLMLGMVAFVVDPPDGLLQPATALPVQVYLWADSPETAFVSRAAAAIIVLLTFLLLLNLVAVVIRRRWEKRI